MAIECPTCHFVAGPAEAAANGGTCPQCTRPYRDQPTPLNSEMSMRDMPEPGMEDSGGNPLQEGILGDYQNREKRDESFTASAEPVCSICGGKASDPPMGCPDPIHYEDAPLDDRYYELESMASTKPQFEITDVIVPDPESIRADKEQMEKNADFLDTLGDIGQVAAPVAGGVAGFALGGPAGAALGAGLAGGGMSALNGGNVGDIAQTGLTDAALGGLGGGGAAAMGLKSIPALAGGVGDAAAGAGAASMGADAAAAQGATSSGLGSLMKSAWGKVPTQQLQKAYMTHSLLNDASNMAQPVQQPMQQAPPAAALPTSYYSALDTPSSQGHIPSNNTDDPEQVDFHEKNDESHEDPLSEIGISQGGTDQGPDDFFEANSPAFAQFATLLPKVLDFALSDKSAAGDSDMEALHQALEAEKPGYLDKANDAHGEKIIMALLGGGKGNEEQSDDPLQDNDAPHDPIAEHEATALRPGLESTCPRCGAITDPSSAHCPQCGLTNPQHQGNPMGMTEPQAQSEGFPGAAGSVPVTAAAGQGPNSPQQQAAVAELLQSEGRDQEIPTMITEPWNYAKELSKITGNEEPPPTIGQEGPPPPQTPPGQEGQSPVPPMSAPPGGAGGSQMMSAIKKYAATVDGVAESCPNCGSHSTGYTSYEDGKLGCKTCGHKWKGKEMAKSIEAAHTSLVHEHEVPAVPDTQGEEMQPSDTGEATNHSWVDAQGAPLQVGQSYQMYSSAYDIPDPITIDAVKPDVIEYTIQGEFGLGHRTEMTHEEANVEKLSFVPSEGGAEEAQPEAAEQAPGTAPTPAPGEVTDSSTPHEFGLVANTAAVDIDPAIRMGMEHLGGNHAQMVQTGCPMCENPRMSNVEWKSMLANSMGPNHQKTYNEIMHQREIELGTRQADFNDINPPGMDAAGGEEPLPPGVDNNVTRTDAGQANRLAQMLMKEGFPQAMAEAKAVELVRSLGQHEMHGVAEDIQAAPETQHPLGPSYGSTEENVETAGDWLLEDDTPDPDDLRPRTAGAKMTPWEQRDYIDEMGDARNSDKMNLGGTHYEMDDLSESFLWG